MIAALGVDELDADAHPVGALNAALYDVADVQLTADLLQIGEACPKVEAVLRPITKPADARRSSGQASRSRRRRNTPVRDRRTCW